MVVQCCVCQRFRHEGEWMAGTLIDAVQEEVSHGYCPACTKQAFEEIRELHRAPALQARAVASI